MTFTLALAAGTGTAAVSDPIAIGTEFRRLPSRLRPEFLAADETFAFPDGGMNAAAHAHGGAPAKDSRVGQIE